MMYASQSKPRLPFSRNCSVMLMGQKTHLCLRFPMKSCNPISAKTLRQKTVRIITSDSFFTDCIRAPTIVFRPVHTQTTPTHTYIHAQTDVQKCTHMKTATSHMDTIVRIHTKTQREKRRVREKLIKYVWKGPDLNFIENYWLIFKIRACILESNMSKLQQILPNLYQICWMI